MVQFWLPDTSAVTNGWGHFILEEVCTMVTAVPVMRFIHTLQGEHTIQGGVEGGGLL